MNEMINKVTEENVIYELSVDELENVNGGLCAGDIVCRLMECREFLDQF